MIQRRSNNKSGALVTSNTTGGIGPKRGKRKSTSLSLLFGVFVTACFLLVLLPSSLRRPTNEETASRTAVPPRNDNKTKKTTTQTKQINQEKNISPKQEEKKEGASKTADKQETKVKSPKRLLSYQQDMSDEENKEETAEKEKTPPPPPPKIKRKRIHKVKEKPFRPKLHNATSLTSVIYYRGQKWAPGKKLLRAAFNISDTVIDTITTSHASNILQFEGQVATWGSHHSIRYFFGTTEEDNAQPKCHERLTQADALTIAEYCSGKAWKRANPKIKFIRNLYARTDFLSQHSKGPGWMCAHKSFSHALGKLGNFYRNELAAGDFELPDFLFIQDDDTYYNILNMLDFLQDKDPDHPEANAGCLVRLPVSEIVFSHPVGGFGFFLSRGAIEQLIRPVRCDDEAAKKTDKFTKTVCDQLAENLVGEAFGWRDGMSVSDLMDAHATYYPMHRYSKWRQPGYCMHGDWTLGYFANYYGLGTPHRYFHDEKVRIEQDLGYSYEQVEGNCNHMGQIQCGPDAHVCHKIHSTSMTFLTRKFRRLNPNEFSDTPAQGKKL